MVVIAFPPEQFGIDCRVKSRITVANPSGLATATRTLLFATGVAALHAFATHLGASGAHLVVWELLASLGAHFARFGTGFTADRHHRPTAATNCQALLAELRAIEAGFGTLGVGFAPTRREFGAVRVTLQAFGQAFRASHAAFGAAVFHFLELVFGPDVADAREYGDAGPDTCNNFSTIHGDLPDQIEKGKPDKEHPNQVVLKGRLPAKACTLAGSHPSTDRATGTGHPGANTFHPSWLDFGDHGTFTTNGTMRT
jgi:hypothetical protein